MYRSLEIDWQSREDMYKRKIDVSNVPISAKAITRGRKPIYYMLWGARFWQRNASATQS